MNFYLGTVMISLGYRMKWDHLDILAIGQSDIHCKIKETNLKPI